MDNITTTAQELVAEFVRKHLAYDLRIAARALRATSWPGEMAEAMQQRSYRLYCAAVQLEELGVVDGQSW